MTRSWWLGQNLKDTMRWYIDSLISSYARIASKTSLNPTSSSNPVNLRKSAQKFIYSYTGKRYRSLSCWEKWYEMFLSINYQTSSNWLYSSMVGYFMAFPSSMSCLHQIGMSSQIYKQVNILGRFFFQEYFKLDDVLSWSSH